MVPDSPVKDSIPRLQQLLPHMRAQLVGLRGGSTFEQARRRYDATVQALVAQGRGRAASRMTGTDRYWAPTRDLLDETMRLNFVERQKLPSTRKHMDAYRGCRYKLTLVGERVAAEARENVATFSDTLADAIYNAHPHFRTFVSILENAPVFYPQITEGEVERSRRRDDGTERWVDYAADGLGRGALTESETAIVRETVISVVRRRFGRHRGKQPTSKELADTLNDAFEQAAMRLRGLSIGATGFNILRSWGSQLRLLDQSRYVSHYEGRNIVWLAADICNDNGFRIRRRTLDGYRRKASKAVITAYRALAEASNSALNAPYIPIYCVRADAAFLCRVTRALVDLAIERLTAEHAPDLGFDIYLHLGHTLQPSSEPVYRRGGQRHYEMTMQPRNRLGGRHAA